MTNDELRRLVRALVHDIGKYIARTARNVREGEWTSELTESLVADLYDLKGERALQAFLRLAPAGSAGFPEWRIVKHLLTELDGMEAGILKGEARVIHAAAEKALLVEHTLRMALDRIDKA